MRQHRIGLGLQAAGTVGGALAFGCQQARGRTLQDGQLSADKIGAGVHLDRIEEIHPHAHAQQVGFVVPG
ncbi:MAG: hypothetical protein A3E25_23085 [Burkholderiales bacterium RIFCSPHIGHO2_12_FULL_69_20]|nr:MAG: hypothetical protein A3E25_23085 [Burkholderiales bacterium RIFCSPHIGHO2_12_FULL_69_20]